MDEILKKLRIVLCDDCDFDYHKCEGYYEYCRADMVGAYNQGKADAIDEFVKIFKSRTSMENKLVDEIAEQLKECK